ncbi:MAG: hypothetical protein IJR12_04160 [Bacteroidales bacterium]|nr:hypothetical protein [Bacteroidales bacterium]
MKKLIHIALLILLTSGSAFAQYIPQSMTFSGGRLRDEVGERLTDEDILFAVGESIYYDTYVGSCSQINVGRGLTIAGGALAILGTAGLINGNIFYNIEDIDPTSGIKPKKSAGMALIGIGGSFIYVGAHLFSIGIPLWITGTQRLKWVAKDYNSRNTSTISSLRFGAGQYGTGVVLSF